MAHHVIEHADAKLKRSTGCVGCALPADCERCQRFTCNRCERAVGWECGAADDAPALCDECWGAVIEPEDPGRLDCGQPGQHLCTRSIER